MKRIAALLAFSIVLAGAAFAQTVDCLQANVTPETFEVKGIANDEKGPLRNVIVIAFPYILPENRPAARFGLQNTFVIKDMGRRNNEYVYKARNEGAQTMDNPTAQTGEGGGFTLKVSKALFLLPCNCKGCLTYKKGELALGIFTEVGKGRWESSRELVRVTFDPNAPTTDAGELTFTTAGPDK